MKHNVVEIKGHKFHIIIDGYLYDLEHGVYLVDPVTKEEYKIEAYEKASYLNQFKIGKNEYNVYATEEGMIRIALASPKNAKASKDAFTFLIKSRDWNEDITLKKTVIVNTGAPKYEADKTTLTLNINEAFGKRMTDEDRMRFDTEELYVKTPEEMKEYFSNIPIFPLYSFSIYFVSTA